MLLLLLIVVIIVIIYFKFYKKSKSGPTPSPPPPPPPPSQQSGLVTYDKTTNGIMPISLSSTPGISSFMLTATGGTLVGMTIGGTQVSGITGNPTTFTYSSGNVVSGPIAIQVSNPPPTSLSIQITTTKNTNQLQFTILNGTTKTSVFDPCCANATNTSGGAPPAVGQPFPCANLIRTYTINTSALTGMTAGSYIIFQLVIYDNGSTGSVVGGPTSSSISTFYVYM